MLSVPRCLCWKRCYLIWFGIMNQIGNQWWKTFETVETVERKRSIIVGTLWIWGENLKTSNLGEIGIHLKSMNCGFDAHILGFHSTNTFPKISFLVTLYLQPTSFWFQFQEYFLQILYYSPALPLLYCPKNILFVFLHLDIFEKYLFFCVHSFPSILI